VQSAIAVLLLSAGVVLGKTLAWVGIAVAVTILMLFALATSLGQGSHPAHGSGDLRGFHDSSARGRALAAGERVGAAGESKSDALSDLTTPSVAQNDTQPAKPHPSEQRDDPFESVTGSAELVIVLNADIQDFPAFSLTIESALAAMFIKKVYSRLLARYFPDAAFFTPTGNGLLLVFEVDSEMLREQTNQLVVQSISAVADFPTLLADDPMINFAVPEGLGVGLARGAATRLVAQDKTLDYSGSVLNRASRLVDLARPAGVVFDETLSPSMLDGTLLAQFARDQVFIRGIDAHNPITIYHTVDTILSPASRTGPL
jgi:class 3 adenylate cyclase